MTAYRQRPLPDIHRRDPLIDAARADGCCDKCDQVRVENVVSWAARIIS